MIPTALKGLNVEKSQNMQTNINKIIKNRDVIAADVIAINIVIVILRNQKSKIL